MRLVEFGECPRFEMVEVDDPLPGPGEVVVGVVTASLNRRDPWIWRASGYCPAPVTLGPDGAGIVSIVGEGVAGDEARGRGRHQPHSQLGEGCDVPGLDFDSLGAPLDGTVTDQILVPACNVGVRRLASAGSEQAPFRSPG